MIFGLSTVLRGQLKQTKKHAWKNRSQKDLYKIDRVNFNAAFK